MLTLDPFCRILHTAPQMLSESSPYCSPINESSNSSHKTSSNSVLVFST